MTVHSDFGGSVEREEHVLHTRLITGADSAMRGDNSAMNPEKRSFHVSRADKLDEYDVSRASMGFWKLIQFRFVLLPQNTGCRLSKRK